MVLENVYVELTQAFGMRYGTLSYTLNNKSGERSAKWQRLDSGSIQKAWSLFDRLECSLQLVLFEYECKLTILVHTDRYPDGNELYSCMEHEKDSPSIYFSTLEDAAQGDLAKCIGQLWLAIAADADKRRQRNNQAYALIRQ